MSDTHLGVTMVDHQDHLRVTHRAIDATRLLLTFGRPADVDTFGTLKRVEVLSLSKASNQSPLHVVQWSI